MQKVKFKMSHPDKPYRSEEISPKVYAHLREPPGDGVIDIEVMSWMFNFIFFTASEQRAVMACNEEHTKTPHIFDISQLYC